MLAAHDLSAHAAPVPARIAAGGANRRTRWQWVPARARPYLRYARARGSGLIGRDHFPGKAGLDRKLLDHVGHIRGGTFIEAGAYDGIAQSNSWHLEHALGWRGLLIEPIPEMAVLCRRFRRSAVENCALGSFAQDGTILTMQFGGLMTTAQGAAQRRMIGGSVAAHAAGGAAGVGLAPYSFAAPVVALSRLIDRRGLGRVDLLSLDVEGLEADVLAGIDFARHRIDLMLIETVDPVRVENLLGDRYERVARLAHHDYLFGRIDREHRSA